MIGQLGSLPLIIGRERSSFLLTSGIAEPIAGELLTNGNTAQESSNHNIGQITADSNFCESPGGNVEFQIKDPNRKDKEGILQHQNSQKESICHHENNSERHGDDGSNNGHKDVENNNLFSL